MSNTAYQTAKRTSRGKAETLRRKAIRAEKYSPVKVTGKKG